MTTTVQVSIDHLFRLAELAVTSDEAAATAAYEILIDDQSQEVRLKARVQLARLERKQGHFRAAAALLQRVLEQRPGATNVQKELAQVNRQMSREGTSSIQADGAKSLVEVHRSGLSPMRR